MRTPGTIGGVHHVASVVPDAEQAASLHEAAFAWRRLVDESATSSQAQTLGRILGASDTTHFRTVMLESPEERPGARVEFVQLTTARGPGHIVLPGLHVTSYRVRDIAESWSRLVQLNADVVQAPVDITVARWHVRVASARDASGGVIEPVQFI